jgi:hypothetical protein
MLPCSAAKLIVEWQRWVRPGRGGMSALSPFYNFGHWLVRSARQKSANTGR